MKPIIGAALVSWLLLAPPIDTGWKADFDPSTPMSRWSVVNTYDTAQECNLVRDGRIVVAMRALEGVEEADGPVSQLKRIRRHRLLIWDYLWECASSDDPRLRGAD